MRLEFRRTVVVLLTSPALAASLPARADSAAPSDPRSPQRVHRHALYVDALGRGGLWGLGYDYQLTGRFAVGATGSFHSLDAQRVWNVSPYLSFYPASSNSGHHRWLLQAGPQFLRTSTASPVPEWDGMSAYKLSAVAATGYEYRSRFLFRAYGMAAIGAGGVTPWVGFSLGRTL